MDCSQQKKVGEGFRATATRQKNIANAMQEVITSIQGKINKSLGEAATYRERAKRLRMTAIAINLCGPNMSYGESDSATADTKAEENEGKASTCEKNANIYLDMLKGLRQDLNDANAAATANEERANSLDSPPNQ